MGGRKGGKGGKRRKPRVSIAESVFGKKKPRATRSRDSERVSIAESVFGKKKPRATRSRDSEPRMSMLQKKLPVMAGKRKGKKKTKRNGAPPPGNIAGRIDVLVEEAEEENGSDAERQKEDGGREPSKSRPGAKKEKSSRDVTKAGAKKEKSSKDVTKAARKEASSKDAAKDAAVEESAKGVEDF